MKKHRKILLGVLTAAMMLVLAAFLLALAMGNRVYWRDVRSGASAWEYGNLSVTQHGVRFEQAFADNRVACVVFDENRQMVEAEGFAPIDFDRETFWGIWTYEDFVGLYGGPHFYIGNVTEAWITDDGYIICMWMPGEWFYPFPLQATPLAGEVTVYDLIGGGAGEDFHAEE